MPVDSFKYLPGSIAAYYRNLAVERAEPIAWTPLAKPLSECRFALVTTAGVYVKDTEPPFDMEREKREPMWGDPTYRRIPRDVRQEQIGASHLHINNRDLLEDINIVLPVHRFLELEGEGVIGSLAPTNYSFMGYQMNNSEWREKYAPEVAGLMKDEAVDAVLLTPAWPDCHRNVPVLAQIFERAGFSTVVVTGIPYWSEKMGVPRTIAAEFPFGHQLGMPGNRVMQMTVIRAALALLEEAKAPGEIRELDLEWPQPFDEAKKDWQPAVPSPVVQMMIDQRRAAAQAARQDPPS